MYYTQEINKYYYMYIYIANSKTILFLNKKIYNSNNYNSINQKQLNLQFYASK